MHRPIRPGAVCVFVAKSLVNYPFPQMASSVKGTELLKACSSDSRFPGSPLAQHCKCREWRTRLASTEVLFKAHRVLISVDTSIGQEARNE